MFVIPLNVIIQILLYIPDTRIKRLWMFRILHMVLCNHHELLF